MSSSLKYFELDLQQKNEIKMSNFHLFFIINEMGKRFMLCSALSSLNFAFSALSTAAFGSLPLFSGEQFPFLSPEGSGTW